jgi:drug/metabolite transporter (DMT)-like permease
MPPDARQSGNLPSYNPPRVTDRQRGILYIAGAALLWSTGGIGIKAISDPPLKVTFYRSLFAAIGLFILLGRDVWGRRRWRSSMTFAIAIVSYCACLTTFVVATKWTTAANAIFLQYAGVIWVLLFSPLVLREPMRSRDVIAISVAIGGMALFFVGRFETRGMAGNAMALLSSIFFAALILALRRENDAAQSAIIWGNVALALVMLPAVHDQLALTAKSFGVLLFLGVFQIARLRPVRARAQIRDRDAGIAHRHARADRESDLGPAVSRRAALGLRDRGRGGGARRNRVAHDVGEAGNRLAGSRLIVSPCVIRHPSSVLRLFLAQWPPCPTST